MLDVVFVDVFVIVFVNTSAVVIVALVGTTIKYVSVVVIRNIITPIINGNFCCVFTFYIVAKCIYIYLKYFLFLLSRYCQ